MTLDSWDDIEIMNYMNDIQVMSYCVKSIPRKINYKKGYFPLGVIRMDVNEDSRTCGGQYQEQQQRIVPDGCGILLHDMIPNDSRNVVVGAEVK